MITFGVSLLPMDAPTDLGNKFYHSNESSQFRLYSGLFGEAPILYKISKTKVYLSALSLKGEPTELQ
jgi:hypothetical protein